MLICMAVVIYIFSPSANDPSPQQEASKIRDGSIPAETRASHDKLPSMAVSAESRAAQRAGHPGEAIEISTHLSASEGEQVSPEEQAVQWEEQAFSELSDLQTRAEALVNLARVDASRGEQAFGMMIASDKVDDRHLAIALLREWRDRTGDPYGRIGALLLQAASDPDAGVAYQARAALDPVESYAQGDDAYVADVSYSSSLEAGTE
jgi:hypothetical protein